ncbi:molybdenum cofactor biosynthesis protein MoaE [Ascidiimonas aurantiaca]|uniref:molybdenum cofactor biosynthesis protein MoaE n=1 Tax=Ascidiimonas aurantiaca TaxID=1685432 RepID=UPI0030EC63FC
MKKNVSIVSKIDTTRIYEELSHPGSGGSCVFVGSVRDTTNNKIVTSLFFEAYEKMALAEMHKIADQALEKWELNKVILHHVVGTKNIGEPVVVTGASSAHRDACFEACRYLIDTLKEKVPIWKKEFFENHETWVSAHP